MDVSIIIPSWNTKKLTCNCIDSIYEHAGNIDYEIIVVENGSSDNSLQSIQAEFPQVNLIINQTNRGYAAACNQGIRLAKSRYVLLLNTDTLICDSAIEKTVHYADNHPEAAIVTCQVRKSPDTVQQTCFRFPSIPNLFLRTFGLAKIFKKNRILGREWMRWWQRDSEREVDAVSGMFMLVRCKAIDQIGLMDEDYFFYGEEVDWCYRFTNAGWKIMFWPGAYIIHVHGGGQSSKKTPVKLTIQQQKSDLLFFRKHHGLISYLCARLIMVIMFTLRYPLWLILQAMSSKPDQRAAYKLEKQKAWWALKYCVFGTVPKDNKPKPTKHLTKKAISIIQFASATIYSVILPLIHKKPRRVVLYYHSFSKQDAQQFEKQIAYVAKKCSVVKPSQIMTAYPNGTKTLTAITFDDAFTCFVENALPILKKYALVAGVSIPTGCLGRPPQWYIEQNCCDKNELIITKQDILKLDRTGFELFSHSVSHPLLTKLDPWNLRIELLSSKRLLEKLVGHEISGICYPYGDNNEKVHQMAKKTGYKLGFTTEPILANNAANNFQIGRFAVSPTDSLAKFKLKANGAYHATKYLKQLKRVFTRTNRNPNRCHMK